MTAVTADKTDVATHALPGDEGRAGRGLGVRARLLLAFFAISGFSILAAAAGIYAFRQVGEGLELIDARVPQVISSLAVSRAADRL